MARVERTDVGVEVMVTDEGAEVNVFASSARGKVALYIHGEFLFARTFSGTRLTLDEARALRRTITKVIREVEAQEENV